MKIKTSELSGVQLDWAVAKAEGRFDELDFEAVPPQFRGNMSYSTDWSLGGPIIERERIRLDQMPYPKELWIAGHDSSHDMVSGPTPLVAAMRCYVASKLGDEIELPVELGAEVS